MLGHRDYSRLRCGVAETSSGSQQRCLCGTDDQGAPGHRECATYRLRALQVRKVTWHLPLELGEIARDGCHVEASEDRFLWLTVEQEPKGRLEIALWGMLAGR